MLTESDLLLLWGKTDRDENKKVRATHPLLCHMLDVGAVAQALCNCCLTPGIRQDLAGRLGCDQDDLGPTLAFWASLHDLGKACPAFQRMYPECIPALKDLGLTFGRRGNTKVYHGQVTGWALRDILEDMGFAPGIAYTVTQSVAGHHGQWPTARAICSLSKRQVGRGGWDDVRRAICALLRDLYAPMLDMTDPDDESLAYLGAWLSGLVSTADWIGSMTDFFPLAGAIADARDYLAAANAQAAKVIDALGWDDWAPPKEGATFEELFPGWAPRDMQAAVIQAAEGWTGPGLAILEAPTGSGKTEAALYLADRWAHTCQQRGLYVAMPTMATSNQMHGRAQKMLERRYGGQVQTLLVHSQARWREQPRRINLAHEEGERRSYEAMSWFLPRKRSLLAPLGVGTVDQALLSVLQTRHFFVRLFGLAHKTIIFDEVHAYDTYMATLFERLLIWLRGLGASVVILSATLPQRTRAMLLRAYGGDQVMAQGAASYPCLSWVSGGQTRCETGCVTLPAPDDHTLALDWLRREPEAIADALAGALTQGGCAAVICNTVRRAQEVYHAIKARGLVDDTDLILFHARFPVWRRQEIEQDVLARFGKQGGHRPQRAIVVATQVIEQSLDLDFDLMISDMAPVDLLIQRAGRLHRHEREARPALLANPRLCIACEAPDGPLPSFENDPIYDRYVMLRSWLTLQGRHSLSLPGELRKLIEMVYGDAQPPGADDPGVAEELERARAKLNKEDGAEVFDAKTCLIPPPDDEDVLAFHSRALSEEDPSEQQALQAHTRNGPPSITLVCLHQTERGLVLEPHLPKPVDVSQMPSREITRDLVQHSVSVSLRRVYWHFAEQEPPTGWARHPLLRYDRLAMFEEGRCRLGDSVWSLVLDDEYGLELVKEEV